MEKTKFIEVPSTHINPGHTIVFTIAWVVATIVGIVVSRII